jgi:hypothetical protein
MQWREEMKPLDHPFVASVFSVGRGADRAAEARLPANALVVVIEDRAMEMPLLPLPSWPNYRSEGESLPAIRHNAEKAYLARPHGGAPLINVSG